MIVTKQLILDGRSRNGGWSRKQVLILGLAWPLTHGWMKRVIGNPISDSDARLFLELKDKHVKPKAQP